MPVIKVMYHFSSVKPAVRTYTNVSLKHYLQWGHAVSFQRFYNSRVSQRPTRNRFSLRLVIIATVRARILSTFQLSLGRKADFLHLPLRKPLLKVILISIL